MTRFTRSTLPRILNRIQARLARFSAWLSRPQKPGEPRRARTESTPKLRDAVALVARKTAVLALTSATIVGLVLFPTSALVLAYYAIALYTLALVGRSLFLLIDEVV